MLLLQLAADRYCPYALQGGAAATLHCSHGRRKHSLGRLVLGGSSAVQHTSLK